MITIALAGWLLLQVASETYFGIGDVSAGTPLDTKSFLVAGDEGSSGSALAVFTQDHPQAPQARLSLSPTALEIDEQAELELDLEGTAQLGELIYCVGSHSASNKGKPRPNRHRLFAVRVVRESSEWKVEIKGKPYCSLVADLARDSRYRHLELSKAAGLGPKEEGGLSIEGLAASPRGDLLIGFRNPIPQGRALVVPLVNPLEVIKGRAAQFGPPVLLDLHGQGIRSFEWCDHMQCFYIVAGNAGSGGPSKLYSWTGNPHQQPERLKGIDLYELNPEGMIIQGSTLILLSDDGNKANASGETVPTFRAVRMELQFK